MLRFLNRARANRLIYNSDEVAETSATKPKSDPDTNGSQVGVIRIFDVALHTMTNTSITRDYLLFFSMRLFSIRDQLEGKGAKRR